MEFKDLRNLLLDFDVKSEEFLLCQSFIYYLEDSQFKNISAHGVDEKGEPKDCDFGYPHRWDVNYVLGRFSKMYYLDEDYIQKNPDIPMTFLSITIRQKKDRLGNVIESVGLMREYFRALSYAWRLLRREMLDMGHKIDYVGNVEPHQVNTGNPHHHTLIFDRFTENEKNHLKRKFEGWGFGSFEHGLDFQDNVKIKNIRSYLLSYMLKSLPGYKTKFKEKEQKWSSSDLLFNAVAWENKFRTWHASKKITSIMKYDKYRKPIKELSELMDIESNESQYREYLISVEPKIEWFETHLSIIDEETKIIWRKNNETEIKQK